MISMPRKVNLVYIFVYILDYTLWCSEAAAELVLRGYTSQCSGKHELSEIKQESPS